jgi:hypothetical protein
MWGLKQSCNPRRKFFNIMWHATWTQGYQGDSHLLVVRSQINNLIPGPSFGHKLCFKYPNGSCKPSLNIYIPRAPSCRILFLCKYKIYFICNHSLRFYIIICILWFLSYNWSLDFYYIMFFAHAYVYYIYNIYVAWMVAKIFFFSTFIFFV